MPSEDPVSCLEDSNSDPQDDSREAEIQEMGSSIMLSQSFLNGSVSWKTPTSTLSQDHRIMLNLPGVSAHIEK